MAEDEGSEAEPPKESPTPSGTPALWALAAKAKPRRRTPARQEPADLAALGLLTPAGDGIPPLLVSKGASTPPPAVETTRPVEINASRASQPASSKPRDSAVSRVGLWVPLLLGGLASGWWLTARSLPAPAEVRVAALPDETASVPPSPPAALPAEPAPDPARADPEPQTMSESAASEPARAIPPSGTGSPEPIKPVTATQAVTDRPKLAAETAPSAAAPKPAEVPAIATSPAEPAPIIEEEAPPFDKTAALEALNAAAAQASSCRAPGDPSGTATIQVTFAPSGRVTSAQVQGPPFAGTATGGCIATTLRSARVPAFSGPMVRVSKYVVIQ